MIQDCCFLTPDDVGEAPELASLAVLDIAIQTTRVVLLSIRAEMRDPQDEHRAHDTGILRTLLILGDALGDQIDVYYKNLERQQRQDRRQVATRDF